MNYNQQMPNQQFQQMPNQQFQNQQYNQPPQQRPQYQPQKTSNTDLKKLFTLFAVASSILSFGFFFMPLAERMSGVSLLSISLLVGVAYISLLGGITCSILTHLMKQRMIHIGTISAMGCSLLFLFIAIFTSSFDFGIGFLFYFLSSAASITFSALLLASKQ